MPPVSELYYMPTMPSYRLYPLGDHAVTLDFGGGIDPPINDWVLAVFRYLQDNPVKGIIDIIPAYTTVTLVYDILTVKKLFPYSTASEYIGTLLKKALPAISLSGASEKTQLLHIPVCYDPALGADLEALATTKGFSTDEVIRRHSDRTYRVFMLGFLPGFAYMGPVDPSIAAPRLAEPRMAVPAGAVGIAGAQTGIYPIASPGGWQLIGQTPWRMYDPGRIKPCLLAPGDEVRFYPISPAEFENMKNNEPADH